MNAADDYIAYLRASGLADNSIRIARAIMRALWLEFENPILESRENLERFINAAHLKQKSKISRFSNMRKYFKWLKANGYILANTMDDIDAPVLPKTLPSNVMTKREATQMLEAIEIVPGDYISYRNRLLLELLYNCSLRRSDLVNLDVEDYDRKDRSLSIRQQKTKTTRISPVGASVAKMLEQYIDQVRPTVESPALFLNHRAGRLDPHYVTVMVNQLRKRVGIKTKASSHSFRKTSATLMLKNGASIRSVQLLLGHSDINSTVSYTKLHPTQIIKMHRSKHPREREKALKLPSLSL